MIDAPNSYFLTEEARFGARPRFIYSIYPYYFQNGIAAGSGSFVNTAFVAPDKIETSSLAIGSWTSPVLSGINDSWPIPITCSWVASSPGFAITVSYKTSMDSSALAGMGWTALTNGGQVYFYEYYQFQFIFTPYRSFVYDEPSEEPYAFYVVDTFNPLDPYQSYVTDGGDLAASVSALVLAGSYVIPAGDIIDGGELSMSCPDNFDSLISGDHTLKIVNPAANPNDSTAEGRYSPGHANFLFANEDRWYLKNLQIHFGYERPGTAIIDQILLYEGVIINWGPVSHAVDSTGKEQVKSVEIYSRNRITYLLNTMLGVPQADGTRQPLVYGQVFQSIDQLKGQMILDPSQSINFDNGELSGLYGTATAGGGTIAVDTTNPYSGNYCCRTYAPAAGTSRGEINWISPIGTFFLSGRICFANIPSSPASDAILYLGGGGLIVFYVDSSGAVNAYINGAVIQTSWRIDDYVGNYRDFSLAVTPSKVTAWIDGNEIINNACNPGSFNFLYFGKVGGGGAYTIDWDDWKFWNMYIDNLYQIPGFPFQSIDEIFVEGAIRVESKPRGVINRYITGRNPQAGSISLYPTWGAVAFTDVNNLPSGTITARATKNAITHPVDIIQDVLTKANCSQFIDAGSLAACRADIPNDSINVFAENAKAGDIISEICRACNLIFWMDANKIRLKAYLAIPPTSAVKTITESVGQNIQETVLMDQIKSKVTVKYGWWDVNKKLYQEFINPEMQSQIGDMTQELDLSWGAMVSTESQALAFGKARILLKYLQGGISSIDVIGLLSWARLEVMDVIQMQIPLIRTNEFYYVWSKSLNMTPPYQVKLTVRKFLGES